MERRPRARWPLALVLVPALLLPWITAPRTPARQAADDDPQAQLIERSLRLLEQNPRRSPALDRIYGAFVERGQLDELVGRYAERTRRQPDDGAAWMVLGLLEAQRGRDGAAADAFTHAERLRPTDPLASFYLGQALVLVGRSDDAAAAFDRAIARKPTRPEDVQEIYHALALVHQRAGRAARALEVWQRLEALFPGQARVREQVAQGLAEEGQLEPALARYEALAADPKLAARRPSFVLAAAEVKVRLGRKDAAIADYEGLLRSLPPDDWQAREVERALQDVFLRNDDVAGLVKYCEGVAAREPDNVAALVRLANALRAQGRGADARDWLEKALARAPHRRDLRLALIDLLTQAGDVTRAAAQYEALARQEPRNPDVLREWGRLLLRDPALAPEVRRQKAAEVWRRMLPAAGARPDPAVTAEVAELYRQAEMTNDALALYRQAVEQAPAVAAYRVHLGEYLLALKRPDEALGAWAGMVAGERHTAANLRQLAEVLTDFGFRPRALAALADAVTLEPRDEDLRFAYANLLSQDQQYPAALKQLDEAGRLAGAGAEAGEKVLQERLRVLQAAGTLGDAADALARETVADAPAAAWYRLARYREVQRQWSAANAAIRHSLERPEPNAAARLLAWRAAARIHEGGGNLEEAAAAHRRLAQLDRQNRVEHLTHVVRLESRLARREPALEAGRQLLAAAPNNLEAYRFYADLCLQVGERAEGLEVLRRAVRANPNDGGALTALAAALAEQFQTDEAIQLYWRAYDRRDATLANRLDVIGPLTELYLLDNRFDKLVERLRRARGDAGARRAAALAVAEAYKAAGDLGTARQELEALLAEAPGDLGVLRQLAALAEREADLAAAARYLRQVVKLAPDRAASERLALLLARAGEAEEAAALWQELAGKEKKAERLLPLIDLLFVFRQHDRALDVTRRLLREQPRNWEALYREGVALARLDRPAEARASFAAILDLRLDDDQPGQSHAAGPGPKPAADFPIQDRVNVVGKVVAEAGFAGVASEDQKFWSPADFGQARLGALTWLLALAQHEDRQEEFLRARRAACDPNHKELRGWWDWWYLQLARGDRKEAYRAARVLYGQPDFAANWVFLASLDDRDGYKLRPGVRGQPAVQNPLPGAEVDAVLESYRLLERQRPGWVTPGVFNNVNAELRGAGRVAEADAIYRRGADEPRDLPWAFNLLELAARRGDVAETFKLFEQVVRIQGVSQKPMDGRRFPPLVEASVAFAHLMQVRSDARALPDVLRVLDGYLAFRRARAQVEKVVPLSGKPDPIIPSFRMMLGNSPALLQIPFPTERNRYYDQGGLRVLRKALDLYTRADLVSDLMDHFARQAAGARLPYDQAYGELTLGYLYWWQEEYEPALLHLSRACDLAPDDAQLRLQLAEGYEKLGRLPEALARIDAVPATDHVILQRRETAALRVAARAGNPARAGLAAERLFGLRLDAEAQAELAGQMRQLQMHDLAEAVLARARRQAGARPAALAALLAQYQEQGRTDVVVQLANQILRATMPRAAALQDQADLTARTQALQALARTGKLPELIARVERQLESAPKSTYLLQMLIEYCEASHDRARIRAAYERLARRSPDDPRVQYEVGEKLAQAGDRAAALPHFTAALRRQAGLYSSGNYGFLVLPAYQQANKLGELADALEAGNLRAVNTYAVASLVSALLARDQTRPRGLKLLARAWEVFPEQRDSLVAQFDNDVVLRLPEVFAYERQLLLPPGKDGPADPWFGLNEPAARVLRVATPPQLASLVADLGRAVSDRPAWAGGKALLALAHARENRPDRARPLVAALLDDAAHPPPLAARLVLGSALGQTAALRDVVVRLYEGGVEASLQDPEAWLDGSPVGPLVSLYQKAGRKADARALALRAAAVYAGREVDPNVFGGPIQLQHNSVITLAQQLVQLGYPVDALRLYLAIIRDAEPYPDNYYWVQARQMAESGVTQCMQSVGGESLQSTLRAALPAAAGPGDDASLDLLVVTHPPQADQIRLRSLLAEALLGAGKDQALLAETRTRLAELRARHPDDLQIHVAEALLVLSLNRPAETRAALDRLLRLTEAEPLEALPEGARANARQRAAAQPQVSLWLVARECARDQDLRADADRLAARALEAARRQAEPGFAQALLREAGLLALQRGDRAAAEASWSELLDRSLAFAAKPRAGKKPAPAGPAGQPAAPRAAAGVPALSNAQFRTAVEIAALAARHRLGALSVRAARTALRGGPPVTTDLEQRQRAYAGPFGEEQEVTVEQWLGRLDVLWRDGGLGPAAEYEALVEAVLPEGRPAEVFLYPRPLANDADPPERLHSVGALLARRAVEGGREDDLRRRLAERQDQPRAALPARVLQAQLDLAAHRPAANALRRIAQWLEKETVPANFEVACHAALPALDDPDAAPAAAAVLERVATRPGLGATALRALARTRFRAGDREVGRKFAFGLLRAPAPPPPPPPPPGFPRPQIEDDRPGQAALELARAGLWSDVWDVAGQVADKAPTAGALPAGLWDELARQAAALPPDRRYAHWKAWSMPTAARKSVRAYHAFTTEWPGRPGGGVHALSSLRLLVEAARDAGRLDELAAELGKLADSHVENAGTGLLLARVAQGPGAALDRSLDEFQEDLTRRTPKSGTATPSYLRAGEAFPWADYLVVRACLEQPPLRRRGEALARTLLNSPAAAVYLRRDLAEDPAGHGLLLEVEAPELEEELTGGSGRYSGRDVSEVFVLYREARRAAEGRAFALRLLQAVRSAPEADQDESPFGAVSPRRQNLLTLAEGLVTLGYPADAVAVFREVLSRAGPAAEDESQDWFGNQAGTRLADTLGKLTPAQRPDALAALLSPPGQGEPPGGAGAFDLMLNPEGPADGGARLTSPVEVLLRQCAGDPALRAAAKARLTALARGRPQDLGVAVAVALGALTAGDESEAAAAVARLADLSAAPLPALAAGARPTPAQEAAARPRLGLWLVARACNRLPALRGPAGTLASRAREAAGRLRDHRFLQALLVEAGQLAVQRGDPAAAEAAWSELLASPDAATTVDPVVARLGAENRLHALSLKAIRQSLAAGPAAAPPDDEGEFPSGPRYEMRTYVRNGRRQTVYYSTSGPGRGWRPDGMPTAEQEVANRLAALAALWERHQAPAADVYAALADVVLPEARPLEVFPYAPPLEAGVGGSAGDLLVRWAVRAGRGDDLRTRLEARGRHPLAAVPAHLIEAQLGVARQDARQTSAALAWFAERLGRDAEDATAQNACRAGLAALPLAPVAADARRLVEQAVALLGHDRDFRRIGRVRLALARHLLQAGPKDAAWELIRAGLRPEVVEDAGDEPSRFGRRYPPGFLPPGTGEPTPRRLVEPGEVVSDLARAGRWDEAAEVLGQWADAQGGPGSAYPLYPPADWVLLLRHWSGLPAPERYARLVAWSLPADGRDAVRVVTGPVPFEEPPAVFRAWKAPAENGLLSTARLLVGAAAEAGKLDELAARLRPLAGRKVSEAAAVLTLVEAARAPADAGPAADALLGQTDPPASYPTWPASRRPLTWPTVLAVHACLAEPRLRPAGERLARALLDRTDAADPMLAVLRREWDARDGGPRPALWLPADGDRPSVWQPLWTLRDGELRLEAGTGQNSLRFAYPLAGCFELTVEVASGGDRAGALGYGGGLPAPTDPSRGFLRTTFDPMGNPITLGMPRPGWQRLAVQVEPGKARYLLDGVVFHEDDSPDPASPFLVLAALGQGRAAFRNPRLAGDPEVPREVPLLHGERLDAWTGAYYGKRVRSPGRAGALFAALLAFAGAEPDDWSARDGTLEGRRLTGSPAGQAARTAPVPPAGPVPSVIACRRPLEPGESVSYEFFYQPGETMVHPAVGRLAFLLEPGGVRLHWLAEPDSVSALGVPLDNAVDEPGSRRGPAELPLKAGAWNRAEVALAAGRVTVRLNGVTVCERPVDAAARQSFGLFHYQNHTAARVRNVVLRGDWPGKLSEAQRADLFAPVR